MPDDLFEAVINSLPPGYSITRRLDKGGQGCVFLGSREGKTAAIKIFNQSADPRRIERELQILPRLDNPHLVKVLGYTTLAVKGVPLTLVAYEYYPNGDLRALIQPETEGTEFATLVNIGHQISNAVETLWSHRIVHRDIKPANIVIAESGQYVLADIGIARYLDLSDITLPGGVAGTPGYMSPEQARGRKELTINSDIFSLGVTLYHLAARQHPFQAQQRFISEGCSPTCLSDHRPDLPKTFVHLIHEMMSFRVYDRPVAIKNQFDKLIEV